MKSGICLLIFWWWVPIPKRSNINDSSSSGRHWLCHICQKDKGLQYSITLDSKKFSLLQDLWVQKVLKPRVQSHILQPFVTRFKGAIARRFHSIYPSFQHYDRGDKLFICDIPWETFGNPRQTQTALDIRIPNSHSERPITWSAMQWNPVVTVLNILLSSLY
jgi:hypothetical protein